MLRNGVSLGTTTAKSYPDPAVTQGSSYTYQVIALDAAGNASAAAGKTIVFPDTTKPTAPANLTLTPGSKSITVKWAAATDNVRVKSYRVYRFSTLIATVTSPRPDVHQHRPDDRHVVQLPPDRARRGRQCECGKHHRVGESEVGPRGPGAQPLGRGSGGRPPGRHPERAEGDRRSPSTECVEPRGIEPLTSCLQSRRSTY